MDGSKRRLTMKDEISTIAGLIGGFIATLLGGWDSALITLVIFMAIDFTRLVQARHAVLMACCNVALICSAVSAHFNASAASSLSSSKDARFV